MNRNSMARPPFPDARKIRHDFNALALGNQECCQALDSHRAKA
jgi:hypothetical protein